MSLIILNGYMKRQREKKPQYGDNPGIGELQKIGKEINKMASMGERDRAKTEFESECKKILTPKVDNSDAKAFAKQAVERIKAEVKK